MLVLNRRPGESIVIEPDLRVTVLSVTDRRVWIGLRCEAMSELRVSATVVSAGEARLEIVPASSVAFDGDRVRVTAAAEGDAASAARAGLAVDRRPGERVEVGDDLWVEVVSVTKGNPSISFGGEAIGDAFAITLIRPAGNYVRVGVDAPNRRVYREELWDMVRASGTLAERELGSVLDGGSTHDGNGAHGGGASDAEDAPSDEDGPSLLEPSPLEAARSEPSGAPRAGSDVAAASTVG